MEVVRPSCHLTVTVTATQHAGKMSRRSKVECRDEIDEIRKTADVVQLGHQEMVHREREGGRVFGRGEQGRQVG